MAINKIEKLAGSAISKLKEAEERARVAEEKVRDMVPRSRYDVACDQYNDAEKARKETKDVFRLAAAEAGAMRSAVEQAVTALEGDGRYSEEVGIIPILRKALATPGPSRLILDVVDAARAVAKDESVPLMTFTANSTMPRLIKALRELDSSPAARPEEER